METFEAIGLISMYFFSLLGNVSVNVQSFAGETALLLAAKKGNHQCVAALLHYGADPNLATPEGYNPLWEGLNKFYLFF